MKKEFGIIVKFEKVNGNNGKKTKSLTVQRTAKSYSLKMSFNFPTDLLTFPKLTLENFVVWIIQIIKRLLLN